MTLGELIDRVMEVTSLDAPGAMDVANMLWQGERDYTENEILYAAAGVQAQVKQDAGETVEHTPLPEMTLDPAEVLRQVYLACPRLVPADDEGKVHVPRIGRAPKEQQDLPQEVIDEFLADLPDYVKLLLLRIDVIEGTMTPVFYDEANDVDRALGSIDLTRFDTPEQLNEALDVLLRRLPRVLASDWN